MAHHLVRKVQHVRKELRRAIEGMSVADMERSVAGVNSIRWIIGHLAWQEQRYWVGGRGLPLIVEHLADYGYGKPVPENGEDFETVFGQWEAVTRASDDWLESLGEQDLREFPATGEIHKGENIGTMLMRVIGHYYVHIGQITAVRKILSYNVPPFVGRQDGAFFE